MPVLTLFWLHVRGVGCSRAGCTAVMSGVRRTARSAGARWSSRYRPGGGGHADRAGARLVENLTALVSRSTLLRLVRALLARRVTPRVLGADEFALRKGHIYGTIPMDIEPRRSVDLLPGRSVPTAAQRLAHRPGVEVICRDRSTACAEAGGLGAPDAVQPVSGCFGGGALVCRLATADGSAGPADPETACGCSPPARPGRGTSADRPELSPVTAPAEARERIPSTRSAHCDALGPEGR